VNGRIVGVVEAVVSAEPLAGADELVVGRRGPLRASTVVAAERVEAVAPAERTLLVAAPARRRATVSPAVRRSVARGVVELVRAMRVTAVVLAPILVRLAHVAGLVALRLVELSARAAALALRLSFRATSWAFRSARARAPVVRRSLARLAMPPSRTQ
jgi:hypothetical protein